MNNIYFKFDKIKHDGQSFSMILNPKLNIPYNYTYNGYPKKSSLLYAMIDGEVKVIKLSKGQILKILDLFPSGKLPTNCKYVILKVDVLNIKVNIKVNIDTSFIDTSFIDLNYKLIDVTDNLIIFDKELEKLIENDTLNNVSQELNL